MFDWVTPEWIGIVAILGGWLVTWLRGRKLPAWAKKWLDKLGDDAVLEAIEAAKRFDTPEERRVEAVRYLQRIADKRFGMELPDSIANLLVEYVYQLYKRARR